MITPRFPLLALFALTGCMGAGGNAFVDPCPAVTGVLDTGAALVAPAKGASGVSTTIGSVSFTETNPDPQDTVFQLQAVSPPSATLTVFRPPITSGAGGVLTATIPTLQPRTTYDAVINVYPSIAGSGCRGLVTADLGTFTTQ